MDKIQFRVLAIGCILVLCLIFVIVYHRGKIENRYGIGKKALVGGFVAVLVGVISIYNRRKNKERVNASEKEIIKINSNFNSIFILSIILIFAISGYFCIKLKIKTDQIVPLILNLDELLNSEEKLIALQANSREYQKEKDQLYHNIILDMGITHETNILSVTLDKEKNQLVRTITNEMSGYDTPWSFHKVLTELPEDLPELISLHNQIELHLYKVRNNMSNSIAVKVEKITPNIDETRPNQKIILTINEEDFKKEKTLLLNSCTHQDMKSDSTYIKSIKVTNQSLLEALNEEYQAIKCKIDIIMSSGTKQQLEELNYRVKKHITKSQLLFLVYEINRFRIKALSYDIELKKWNSLPKFYFKLFEFNLLNYKTIKNDPFIQSIVVPALIVIKEKRERCLTLLITQLNQLYCFYKKAIHAIPLQQPQRLSLILPELLNSQIMIERILHNENNDYKEFIRCRIRACDEINWNNDRYKIVFDKVYNLKKKLAEIKPEDPNTETIEAKATREPILTKYEEALYNNKKTELQYYEFLIKHNQLLLKRKEQSNKDSKIKIMEKELKNKRNLFNNALQSMQIIQEQIMDEQIKNKKIGPYYLYEQI